MRFWNRLDSTAHGHSQEGFIYYGILELGDAETNAVQQERVEEDHEGARGRGVQGRGGFQETIRLPRELSAEVETERNCLFQTFPILRSSRTSSGGNSRRDTARRVAAAKG